MKKVLILLMFLLNLLPNISKNGMEIGFSTISAQTFGNEGMAYLCEDEEIGDYISPLPCDEEVCISPCTFPGCMLSFPCDDLYYHMTFDHTKESEDGKPQPNEIPDGNGGGGFPNAKFVDISYLDILKGIIKDPTKIYQGQNGTCGAAVIQKFMAENLPEKYKNIVYNLYQTGKYTDKDGWVLKLPDYLRGVTSEMIRKTGKDEVDFLVQTALINMNNYVLSYNPFDDIDNLVYGIASFCWPNFIGEFIGNNLGIKESIICVDSCAETLYTLDYNKYFVIAEVAIGNSDELNGWFPNHYAQILSTQTDNKIRYWSWGRENISFSSSGIFKLFIFKKRQ